MKVWYSFKDDEAYKGDAPAFFDLTGKKWYEELASNLPTLQKDVLDFVKNSGSKRGSYFNTDLVEGQTWEGIGFLLWGRKNEDNMKQGEALLKYFKDIPGLVSFSISVLSPHTHIKPHYGDTDAIYRVHIPILIPALLPDCGFKVASNPTSWDHIFAFCDAQLHEAWNNTDKPRTIVIIDIIREELLSREKEVCHNVLSYLEIQRLYLKYKLIKNAPWYIQGIIRHLLLLRIKITGRSSMSGT